MIELTQQQRQAVHEQSEVRLIDPQTKEAFVLIRAEAYDKKAPLSALKGLDILPAIRLRARKNCATRTRGRLSSTSPFAVRHSDMDGCTLPDSHGM